MCFPAVRPAGYADGEFHITAVTQQKLPTKGHARFLPHPFQLLSLRAILSVATATCLRHTGLTTADKNIKLLNLTFR